MTRTAERRRVRLAAVLVAGGRGARFGDETPKQFLALGGEPLFLHAARVLAASPIVDSLVVVATPGWETDVGQHLAAARLDRKLSGIVPGGATRQDSVWCGLEAVEGCTHVLVHDAARPFLTERLVQRAVGGAETSGAASVGLPISDTLFRGEADPEAGSPGGARAVAPVPRDGLWSVQTPQVFELELLREAHRQARARGQDATDDGSLVLELGRTLVLVRGAWWNLKVTRTEDLRRAERILAVRALLDTDDEESET